MKVRAYGKLNLSLYITGNRGKLHTLDSVMTTVSVFDELTVLPSSEICVSCEGVAQEDNIAYRAAKLIDAKCGLKLKIDITKGIPMGGGMGGSSADGAAVLYCANVLTEHKLDNDLCQLSAMLGSDVFFMLNGGSCRVGGTGDEVMRIDGDIDLSALIVECGSVSTPECYSAFDRLAARGLNLNDVLISAIERGKPLKDDMLFNDLFDAARSLQPRIAKAEKIIQSFNSLPHLTGSGGCLFVLDPPNGLANALRAEGFACKNISHAPHGVDII